MVHGPNGRLHLEQKGGVIFLMFLEFSTSISNDTMFTFFILLCKDGPESAFVLVVT